MEFVNLTPHAIVLHTNEGEKKVDPSGEVARVSTSETPAGVIGSIPAVVRSMGNATGIPSPKPGVVYLVSAMVLSALEVSGNLRQDVAAPDTGPTAVRNDKGLIQGVKRLIVLKPITQKEATDWVARFLSQ